MVSSLVSHNVFKLYILLASFFIALTCRTCGQTIQLCFEETRIVLLIKTQLITTAFAWLLLNCPKNLPKKTKMVALSLAFVLIITCLAAGAYYLTAVLPQGTSPTSSPTIILLDLWWNTNWASDGSTLNVTYNQVSPTSPPITQIVENKSYGHGVLINSTVITIEQINDHYGRQINTTTTTISFHSTTFFLSPNGLASYGSLFYPNTSSFEQSQFARNFTSTVNYENYTAGSTPNNGSYNEEFSGHIATSAGEITFFGNATASLALLGGVQSYTSYLVKTSYFLNGEPYAETSVTSSYKSSYIVTEYRLIEETVETKTFFADGSQRTSNIVISYTYNETGGFCTGKSGSGTVWGTDLVGGKIVNYNGSISLAFGGFNSAGQKTGYYENRNTTVGLLKRVPFEVFFIDDSFMRPVSS